MRYFYVDTENVSSYDFIENWHLSENDIISMFVSPFSKNIKVQDLKIMTKAKCNFIYKDTIFENNKTIEVQMFIDVALNAKQNGYYMHYIISDNKDAVKFVEYLNSSLNKYTVKLIRPSLDSEMWEFVKSSNNAKDFENKIKDKYGEIVKDELCNTYISTVLENGKNELNKLEIKEKVKKIMLQSKDFNCYRNNLRKCFGDTLGNDLYWKTKEIYKTAKENKFNNLKL